MILFCVLVDREGKMSDVFQSTAIDIYEKKETWELIRHKKLKGFYPKTPAEVRIFSEYLTKDLRDMSCNVLIGTSITGVPYYILDRNGVILCEAQENSETVKNAIYEDFCVEKKEESIKSEMVLEPYVIDEEGTYFYDFVASQRNDKSLTTKKILLPFFEHTRFHTLVLKATHMIPWLTDYAVQNHFSLNVSKKDEAYMIQIEKKSCDEEEESIRCKV